MVIPEALTGQSILDLGSGSGRDCFLLAKFVGQDGHVIGIDMTDEQVKQTLVVTVSNTSSVVNLQQYLFTELKFFV